MNKCEWVTLLHPFQNVERKMKKMLCELRRISMVLFGLDSLLYRINSNNMVLGKDFELIENLFNNTIQFLMFISSNYLHTLLIELKLLHYQWFAKLQIHLLLILKKFTDTNDLI